MSWFFALSLLISFVLVLVLSLLLLLLLFFSWFSCLFDSVCSTDRDERQKANDHTFALHAVQIRHSRFRFWFVINVTYYLFSDKMPNNIHHKCTSFKFLIRTFLVILRFALHLCAPIQLHSGSGSNSSSAYRKRVYKTSYNCIRTYIACSIS